MSRFGLLQSESGSCGFDGYLPARGKACSAPVALPFPRVLPFNPTSLSLLGYGCREGEGSEGRGHRRNGALHVGRARDRMTAGVKSNGEKGAKDHSKVERNEAQT